MRENDNSEILKNNSSLMVAAPAATTTAAAAALYKEIKMDNFNLNSQNSIQNCHSSQNSSSDGILSFI